MAVKESVRKWLSLMVFAPLAGCATFQDVHYEHSQKLRTECAYWHYKWTCEGSIGADYSKGWKAGYLDVLTGGTGQPPLIPPRCYWSPSQVTKHGDEKRHEWYLGFQDGAMMASLEPDTHYIKTWTPPATVHTGQYEYSEPSVHLPASPPQVPPSEAGLSAQPENWNPASPGHLPTGDPSLPPSPIQPERVP